MFEKEELALIHKAVSELVIKGSDSHIVSILLNKVVALHETPQPGPPSKAKAERAYQLQTLESWENYGMILVRENQS